MWYIDLQYSFDSQINPIKASGALTLWILDEGSDPGLELNKSSCAVKPSAGASLARAVKRNAST